MSNGRGRDPRAAIAVPLRLRFPDLDSLFDGRAVNISRSGMYIALESPPAVGTVLSVGLSTQAGRLLDATVEVVRRVDAGSERGAGVRFLDISFGAQALIDRMLADESLFGDYRLDALLGQGDMAEVYCARDLTSDEAGRVVALKRILPELTRDRHMARLFRKEAGIARRLRHPHIVQTYDVGELEGRIYIVMEYVDGCHLGQLISLCRARGVRVPVELACYLGRCVAEALDCAHSLRDGRERPLSLVHRDVTPSNLLISRGGDIKVGDFGVARVRHGRGEQPGARVGKDLYAAPEQLRGGDLTPAADVYSLGATLFELVTGRAAFDRDPDEKLSARPPSARELRADVPESVAAVISRALTPVLPGEGPEPRYPNARALADALAAVSDPGSGDRLAVSSVVRRLLG